MPRLARLSFAASLVALLSLALLWSLIDPIVQFVYDERAASFVNDLMPNRDRYDVVRYQADAREIVAPLLRRAAMLAGIVSIFAVSSHLQVRGTLERIGVRTERLNDANVRAVGWIIGAIFLVGLAPVSRWLWPVLGLVLIILWFSLVRRDDTCRPITISSATRSSVVLLGLVALASAMRLWRLDLLEPYTDEYSHLQAGRLLSEGGGIRYTRAAIVTRAVAFAYQLNAPLDFMEYVTIGRIPGALMSALTVIPIYFLARRFGSSTAITAGVAWAVHPWATGVGRTIREYAYFPFFSTLAVVLGVVAVRRASGRPFLGLTAVLAVAGATLAYARFDRASTFTAHALIIVGVVGTFWFLQSFAEGTRAIRIALLSSVPAAVVGLLVVLSSMNVPLDVNLADGALTGRRFYFVNLYAGGTAIVSLANFSAIGLLLVVASLRALRGSERHLFIALLVTFLGTLVGMTLGWDRYVRPRYGFFLLPIFIVLLSAGSVTIIGRLWSMLETAVEESARTRTRIVLTVVLLVFAVPLADLTYNVRSERHGYVRFTNEYHDRVSGVVAFMQREATASDALVATGVIVTPLRLVDADIVADRGRVAGYGYRSSTRHELVKETIIANATGFVALDARRTGWTQSLPREDFRITAGGGEICVRILDRIDSNWMWRWDHNDVVDCAGTVDLERWLVGED